MIITFVHAGIEPEAEGVAEGVIVDAICYVNGTIVYTTGLNVEIETGIHLEYNCTGRSQSVVSQCLIGVKPHTPWM